MDKKSVILFVSFLLLLGVVFVAADLASVSYLKSGDDYNVVGWTKGGVPTNVSVTIAATGSGAEQLITNITLTIDQANYTWMFVSLAGLAEEDSNLTDTEGLTNVTYGATGAALDWTCMNTTDGFISCWNNTDFTALNASMTDNSSITILLNVTGVTGSEGLSVNWTITTGGAGEATGGNQSSFVTSNDGVAPRLLDLNITDGSTTYFNGSTIYPFYFLDGSGTVTITGSLDDANLESTIYLYCSGNSSFGIENASVSSYASVTTTTNSTNKFTFTLPSACIESGNSTTFFFSANDSFNWQIYLNETLDDSGPFHIAFNNTLVPKISLVNVSQFYVDSDGNSRTRSLSSSTGIDGYVGKKNTTIIVELTNEEKNDTAVWLVFVNDTNTINSVVNYGNGNVAPLNETLTLVNLTAVLGTSAATTALFEVSIDVSNDPDNTTYWFYVFSNNTDNNYTAFVGQYTMRVDASAPNEPTMTPPDDRTITPRGSISYKCESSDSQSGLYKMRWELTKPDSTIVKKGFDDFTASAQTVTFSGDDTSVTGTYTVKCIAMDYAGNEVSHTSTTTQDFQVLSSVSYGGGDGEAAEEGVTFDIDFSTSDQATLVVPQGTIKTFTFDGKTQHTITFKEVTATTVTLEISSTPVSVTLVVGEAKNVDINGDGLNDLVVKLNAITDSKADVTVSKVAEGAEVIDQVTPPGEQPPTEQPPAGEEIPPEEVEEVGTAWIWITIIVVIAVIVVGYFLLRKKKQ